MLRPPHPATHPHRAALTLTLGSVRPSVAAGDGSSILKFENLPHALKVRWNRTEAAKGHIAKREILMYQGTSLVARLTASSLLKFPVEPHTPVSRLFLTEALRDFYRYVFPDGLVGALLDTCCRDSLHLSRSNNPFLCLPCVNRKVAGSNPVCGAKFCSCYLLRVFG